MPLHPTNPSVIDHPPSTVLRGRRMRAPALLPIAAAYLLAACGRAADDAARTPSADAADTAATPPAAVVLVDSALPAAAAGDAGWAYHLRANADLDGDGQPERASLIAQVDSTERGFLWDDGQPWQLYVEEADGTRTYAYRRLVQLGTVQAHVSTAASGGGALSILLVENTPQAIRLYEITYAGPGRVTTIERFTREIHPERAFAAEHP
jgi:hypothetical protein